MYIMTDFIRNIEELNYLTPHKCKLTQHLKKNYKVNIHYIIERNNVNNTTKNSRGGHNKISYLLTENAFELLKNSYNLRNRYIVDVSDSIKCVNLGMCVENQTIGFIENAYSNVLKIKRQYVFHPYKVDLYFIHYKLVIECDENNHIDRDPKDEIVREKYIISLGNKIIRYNPNEPTFDLSNVLKDINKLLFYGVILD